MPQWQPTGDTRCKPCPQDPSGIHFTNILQRDEIDVNPQSITYNQHRWTDVGPSSGCDVNADWQFVMPEEVRCRVINNQNTGELEQKQTDTNPCSNSYGLYRWIVIGVNNTTCPVATQCNGSNCTGEDKKCINNACETGVKKYLTSTWSKSLQLWVCTYIYTWSDGSQSNVYTEYSPTNCFTADHL
jgi:hypothetical protein